jgi:hypothetical protein
MATQVDVKKLRRGLKKLKPYTPYYEEIKNHSELRNILLMIDLGSIDFSAFSEESARQLSNLYNRDEADTLEEGLSEAAHLIKTLNNLPPGGDSDDRFF